MDNKESDIKKGKIIQLDRHIENWLLSPEPCEDTWLSQIDIVEKHLQEEEALLQEVFRERALPRTWRLQQALPEEDLVYYQLKSGLYRCILLSLTDLGDEEVMMKEQCHQEFARIMFYTQENLIFSLMQDPKLWTDVEDTDRWYDPLFYRKLVQLPLIARLKLLDCYVGYSRILADCSGDIFDEYPLYESEETCDYWENDYCILLQKLQQDTDHQIQELCTRCFDFVWDKMKAEKRENRNKQLSKWNDRILEIYSNGREDCEV